MLGRSTRQSGPCRLGEVCGLSFRYYAVFVSSDYFLSLRNSFILIGENQGGHHSNFQRPGNAIPFLFSGALVGKTIEGDIHLVPISDGAAVGDLGKFTRKLETDAV